MIPKYRILVVDDAVVFRRLVADALTSDPELEVAGTAPNGRIALAKMSQVNPDLVILDVDMPELDGLETLKEIRKAYPRLPVIMFSALTETGATATLDALALGATDYFTKPSNLGGLDASLKVLQDELIPEIKALCKRGRDVATSLTAPEVAPPLPVAPRLPGRVDVLAIGASTGGPNALAEILPSLPADFPVPVVIVQHMPPLFTKLLAERLASKCSLQVQEAVSGSVLDRGQIWIAPGDFHLVLVRDGAVVRALTHQDPPENSCRPAVDVLFRSVANTYGPGALAVVLTGMGSDGLRGCECIRHAGGQVIAQDESSSIVWGMPGFVARAGLADKILPLEEVSGEVLNRTHLRRVAGPPLANGRLTL